jgi:ABC-2 type transport system permease protein
MNASIPLDGDTPRAVVAPPHATHKFKLLLRREFWEHKGGFFWAPIVAGAISLLLTTMVIIVGEVVARRALADGKLNIDNDITINGLDLGQLTSKLSPDDLQNLSHGLDMAFLASSSWPFMVLGFVVFFYCLGALYDERKDRSVLFWKSLPLSDRDTVLSKVASAVVVAPAIAVGAAIATMFAFIILLSLVTLVHGGNPFTLVWGPGSPLAVAGNLVAMLPMYALWALPTVGWLMLCSAWSRSKPFLWAVMIPVFAGIFVAWFDVMNVFNLDTEWFVQHIVFRALGSVFPGTWFTAADMSHINGPDDLTLMTGLKGTYSLLASPQLWVGVVAGAAMIFGAIKLRRWRDDNA